MAMVKKNHREDHHCQWKRCRNGNAGGDAVGSACLRVFILSISVTAG